MRKLVLIISAMILWLGVFSQGTLPYNDDFESYTTGGFLAVQSPTWWTTWSNLPGSAEDGQISTAFAHSGTKSVLCDEVPSPATDQIWKLGNKTTGAYDVKWWMYIETGKCGYFNIQHFQSPGTEYACEIYFRTSGAGELLAGSATPFAFTYPKSTWFEVINKIDLDADLIKLYVNGILVHEWPFHYQAGSTTGTKQLGGIDLYAGAKSGTGELPKFFFDDASYVAFVAPTDPIISVAPTSLTATLATGQTQVKQLTVANTGVANLIFNTSIILNSDAPGVNQVAMISNPSRQSSMSLSNCSASPNFAPSAPKAKTDAPGATAILHYDGDNSSAIGWNSPPITITVAARFPNAMTLPVAGMNLVSVDVYINALNTTGSNLMTVKVYGMGTTYEPGPVLSSQTFTPVGAAWENVVLSTPVLMTGQDIWIGYQFTQTDAGIYIPGTDAGPNDPNGDFLSSGVGWSHLSNNPLLLRNWNIRGNLDGTPSPQWISVAPLSGTVTPGGNQVLDVTFNAANLAQGSYQGIIRILCNDPVTPQVDVPVTLTVVAVNCPLPTGLAATNITNSGASIGWSDAPMVQIDYGSVGHAAGTGTIIPGVVVNPYSLTGLNSLTSYHVYVRQDCGSGVFSPWAGPITVTTLEQYTTTVYPFNVTNGTGYITNGSFLKKGPWMNASATVNDTSGRGYVKFDISSLPVNAIITKATLNYYYFGGVGTSTAVNGIYSLANDPVTTSGAILHTDCGDGAPSWSGTWTGTPPLWFNSTLNAIGTNYITDQLAAGWAGFGFARTSTSLFRFSGYNDATHKPNLQIEYHVATTPLFSVSPSSKNFEQVNLGIQSLPQIFTIKNAGIGTITVDALVLEGVDASQFILTDGTTYSKVLGPGASYTVSVVFKPTSTGDKTANLRITENEIDHFVALTGNGYLNSPQNLTATPVIGPYVNLTWAAPLPLEEIRFDDNSAETFYWIGSPTTTLQRFYTKITIPANGTLTNIGVLSRSSTPTNWESISLCPDNGGIPNLISPIQSFASVPVTSPTGQWILKSLTTPLAVTAGQTFYIVTQWTAGSTVGPSVGTDTYSNHYRCSYSSNGGAIWVTFPYNLMMRAYMTVPGDNSSNEAIVLTSGNEVEGMQNLPTLNIAAEPKPIIHQLSFTAPAILMPSNPNRSFTNYSLHRGTVSGTYTTTVTGIAGTTYQDITTDPTTLYYYMVSALYSNGVANSNEVNVTTFETCPVPTALTATGISTISANLGWNPNGTVEWDIEWGPAGFFQGQGTMIPNTTLNPYTLNQLSPGTSYSFYIRSICGGGLFSSWAGPYTFTTLCPSFPAPIYENFELATFPPACWSKSLGTPEWARSTDASGYGIGVASAFADFFNFDLTTPFDLMTLNFDATALYIPVLKFDYAYAAYSASYIDSLKIYYSINNGVSYTLLQGMAGGPSGILNTGGTTTSAFIPTANQWATYTIPIPVGANIIRFSAVSAWGNNLYLDNVKIEGSVLPIGMTALVTNNSCAYSCDGAIDLTVTGGVSPFTYIWSCGSTTQDLTSICGGIYYVTVTDAANSTATGDWTVTEPSEIIVLGAPYGNIVTCFGGSDGSLSANPYGGTPPYTYLWSNQATTSTITGLPAGSYSIQVWDSHSCTGSNGFLVLEPTEIIVTGLIMQASCPNAADGSIDLIVLGGTPGYTFLWSNGATTEDIAGLTAGSYSVTVTDFNNCLKTQSFGVTLASEVCPIITVTGNVTATACYNAYEIIHVAGTPNTFTVFGGGSATFIAGQKIFYYAGTKVLPGGYMLGKIAPNGPWCMPQKIAEAPAGQEELIAGTGNAFFSIFPNPTNGNFTLVQKTEKLYNNVKVEIYGMNGEKMISASMIGEKQHEFKTADLPSGLYFVRVVADSYVETMKLVKTR
ncbi:MAG: choice-of-anchor D domain-containing protein [Bacteroidota bacterium]